MKIILIFAMFLLLFGCSSNNKPNDITQDKTFDITEFSSTEEDIEINSNIKNAVSKEAPANGQLVRICDYIPQAVIDLKYSTANNFTGKVLYDDSEAYLCYGTVKKLINVQSELKEKGFKIVVWDAYRPPEAQWKLWEAYPNSNFVADPRNGLTSHSKGNTVDISIVYEDGSAVELPSDFDEFSAVADRDYSDVSVTARKNAVMLETIMYNNGFTGYKGEWWDYSDTNTYDLIEFSKN